MYPSFRHGAVLVFSLAASSAFGQALQPPTNLVVTSATNSSVQLTWTAAQPQAPGFLVERKPLNGTYAPAPNIPSGGATGVTFMDTGIDPFTTYVYRVSAMSLNGTSTPSNEVTVGPPPAGYTVASPAPGNAGFWGQQVQMVLDANGDPAVGFVYIIGDDSMDFSMSAVYFVSWNRAQYSWNAPVQVAFVNDIRVPSPQSTISLSRDPTNNTFGFAYAVGNDLERLDVALSTDGGVTWKAQTAFANTGFQLQQLAFAMYGGQAFLVYDQTLKGVTYLTGSQSAAPGQWTPTPVPAPPGLTGSPRPAFSLAVDNTGAPGLAYWSSPRTGSNSVLAFWRPGGVNSVVVTDTSSISNDQLGCDLTFFGVQPRIAMFAQRDKTGSYLWTSLSSDGGVTWAAPVNVPDDGRAVTGNYLSIAAGSLGQGALVSELISNNVGAQCGLPKLSVSPDFVTWTTCSPTANQPPQTAPSFVKVAFAGNDLLDVAFENTNFNMTTLGSGVVVWRQPQPPPQP
jgi:hypothetical protein